MITRDEAKILYRMAYHTSASAEEVAATAIIDAYRRGVMAAQDAAFDPIGPMPPAASVAIGVWNVARDPEEPCVTPVKWVDREELREMYKPHLDAGAPAHKCPRTSDVKHDRNCGYGMLEDSDWQDCTCHVHAARKAKRSGAKTDCENCHGTGKWHDIVFDEERQCPCVNGEAMKLPRTKEPLMPVPPVPDDVNSRLAAAARIDTQTGQRTNDPLGNVPPGLEALAREVHQGSDSARTCEDCEDAPAILCRSCVKHACEVAVDHLVDSEGREHCWGCLRGDRRKCPGMPRTEPGMVDPTRSSKDRALAIWDNEKGGTDAEFILAMAASFDALRKETIKECVKEAWGAIQGSCPYAYTCAAYVSESLEGMLTGSVGGKE